VSAEGRPGRHYSEPRGESIVIDLRPFCAFNALMTLESLKAFCDLTDTKSFTRAAQINGVTQSAVSQTITALEKHFKSLLIERSKKNFRLTAEGEVLYEYGKRILQSYDDFQSKLQENKGLISGEIRISTVYSIGLHELPPYIKGFLKDHPSVTMRVQYRRANQVYEEVAGNIVDLGFVAYPARDPKLEIVPLRKDHLVLICHPKHALANAKSIKLKALNGQNFVNFEKDIPTRKALDTLFKAQGVTVNNVMELDNVETVKAAVEVDLGVAIVPVETIKQEVASRTLAEVRLEGNHLRELGVIFKKGKVLSPAARRFIDRFKESL
jgi:LysR family transcriptional regulator, transcriptional activator of the cysJI operon